MQLESCLFCAATEDFTAEHVFPAALGSDDVVEDATCRSCNGQFSRDFESTFNNGLKFFCFFFKIGNRTGVVPTMPATATWDGVPIELRMRSDGTYRMLGRPPVERLGDDGRREIEYYVPTTKDRAKLATWAQSKGKTLMPLPADKPMEIEPRGTIPMNFIEESAALRSAAKVALMAVALKCGLRMAGSDAFAPLRHFIRTGNGEVPVRLFVNHIFSHNVRTGPHQHSVIAYLNGHTNQARAAVRFFGGLSYLVHLSDSYAGADYGFTYVYDAYRREETGMLAGQIEMERVALETILNGHTVYDNPGAAAEHFLQFIDAAIREKTGQSIIADLKGADSP